LDNSQDEPWLKLGSIITPVVAFPWLRQLKQNGSFRARRIEVSMIEDVSFLQYGLVALCALLTGTIGGIAGYGTGLLMPLVLVPIIGAEPVVPIIGLSALLTNSSRILAFWKDLDTRRAVLMGAWPCRPACLEPMAVRS
jgi:hypothetical protein